MHIVLHKHFFSAKTQNLNTMDKLLVDGYVRDAEQSLQGRIIPLDITHLISTYYCMLIRLFCLHFPNGIYIADVNNRHPMKSISWKTDIVSLTSDPFCSFGYGSAMCTTSHIQLPSNVKQKIYNINSEITHNKFDAVFNCGGRVRGLIGYTNCAAVIFNRKQFESTPDESSMYV